MPISHKSKNAQKVRHLKKFLSYYRPHLGMLSADLACAFVAAGASLLFPLVTRWVTKDVLAGNLAAAPGLILSAAAALLALILIQNGCVYFTDAKGHAMGAKMESAMRSELFCHLQKLSPGFYDRTHTGQLLTRITSDLTWITELCHHGPEDLMTTAVRFFGAFGILLSINAPLTWAVFAFLPVIFAYTVVCSRRLNRALLRNKERIADVNAQVSDSLEGIRVVQSFAGQEQEIEKFERENRRFLESRVEGYRREAQFYGVSETLIQLVTAAVVVFGAFAIVGGTLDLADLLAFTMYIGSLLEPVRKWVNFLSLYQEGTTGFHRLAEILDTAPEIADAENAVDPGRVRGEIALRDVRFCYPGSPADVLAGLTLHIAAGEYVALVGASGVGKTTLCSLIPRFYDPAAGSVMIDGTDVRGIALGALRRNIGVVQQEVYLFSGTVLENIRYGRPGATREEVAEAARRSGAHDFIERLPQGYDTDIGQRGVRLSGGQRQRLCIARVFLKDPPVLIFDEATSALDNESERAVQEALEALAEHRTTLVIAHRLSTIRRAGRILVLDESGIAEEGTHEELIARGGVYARLYQSQF